MEGGALRGLFTSGITDIMMENGIEFDGAIGVSAGAAFGCNYKSRQIGRAARYNIKYCRDKRYFGMRSLLFTGNLFGVDFCYHEIPEKLDIFDSEAFNNNPMEFYVVCTDIETGKPVYKKCDKVDENFLDWIRASASLPLVSQIVEVDGYKLLDGGISDSIPLKYFESIGYTKNIVILTQPKGYVKEKNNMMPIIRRVLKGYPLMIKAIENRHNMYNDTLRYIEEKEAAGEILVLRPEEALPIKRTSRDLEKIKQVYEIGRQTGMKNIDIIKDFLAD
ncbi:MAG: patatin family protein [Clostridia bacterium]|nr:patatin family protein [Clostridia bacterium]